MGGRGGIRDGAKEPLLVVNAVDNFTTVDSAAPYSSSSSSSGGGNTFGYNDGSNGTSSSYGAEGSSGSTTTTEYKLYTARWGQLLILCLLQISNAMLWISYAPIITLARKHYAQTASGIDYFSLVYMAAFVPLGIPATWAMNAKGLRRCVLVASFLNALGAWVRFCSEFTDGGGGGGGVADGTVNDLSSNESDSSNLENGGALMRYAIALAGQTLCAIAQPVILDCPTLLSATWFGPNERAEANTLASVSNPIGIGIGSILPPLLVSTCSDIFTMQWVLAVPASVSFLLVLLFLRERPPTPPSASAALPPLAFLSGMRALMRNRAYLLLLAGFSLAVGVFSTFSSVTAQITAGQGYSSDDAGYFNLLIVGTGLVGAGVAGVFVDKTHRFMETLKFVNVITLAGLVLFSFFNRPNYFPVLMAACAVTGFASLGALPVALELCAEATFPVSEGVSAGLMWMGGQVMGIVLLAVVYPLRGEPRYYNGTVAVRNISHLANGSLPPGIIEYYDYSLVCWVFVGCIGVATLLIFFVNTPYKRRDAEHQGKSLAEE